MKLMKTEKYVGTIELLTGLCIKGSNTGLNIGGADSEVIKNPMTLLPYIPGSSVKGKIRSLLEFKYDKTNRSEPCGCGRENCFICTLFGAHKNPNSNAGIPRLIFRDCEMSKDSLKAVNNLPIDQGNWLELKSENTIPRDGGVANPRTIERVPAGITFDLEIILQEFEGDDAKKLKKYVEEGIHLLENSSLGGSGSRGYGHVKVQGKWIDA